MFSTVKSCFLHKKLSQSESLVARFAPAICSAVGSEDKVQYQLKENDKRYVSLRTHENEGEVQTPML